MNDFSHAYCDNCGAIQPVEVEELAIVSRDGEFIGGDIFCTACSNVIATVYKRNFRLLAG